MKKITRSYRCDEGCPVEATLDVIGGRWKGVLLYHLMLGPIRYGKIRKQLPDISDRVLTTQLRQLEADGLLTRTIFAEVPPRVEYALTEKGATLRPIVDALYAWGTEYGRDILAARDSQDEAS